MYAQQNSSERTVGPSASIDSPWFNHTFPILNQQSPVAWVNVQPQK